MGHGSQAGVHRVLRRLAEQGIVNSEVSGQTYRYRLNRRHLAAPLIETLAQPLKLLLERLPSSLSNWEAPAICVSVFGSVARGEAGIASDLDILVVRPDSIDEDDPRWREQVDGLAGDATAMTGNEARILEYSAAEATRLSTAEPLLQEIRRDGLLLMGSLALLMPKTAARA
ncbi:MAG TPA: nucleotidyltransferase domain-containing protein [Candidatus Dormibacteraeota bacterium]|nr:nucleotidyltransferase domain-containing protein [Candidatus Dormibacteraeota bacterium]